MDYTEILKGSIADIPVLKMLPDGTWRLVGKSAKFLEPKSADSNAQFLFVYNVMEPLEDVDEDEFAALGEDYDLGTNTIFYRIWIENAADFQKVVKHMEKHGIDMTGQPSLEEAAKKAFKGTEVLARLEADSYEDANGEIQEQMRASQFVETDD